MIALTVIAAVGAGCDACRRAEPEPEPSRIDRLLDAGTDRATDEFRNREAPER